MGILGTICYAVSRSLQIISSDLSEKEVPPAVAEVIKMLEMPLKNCRPSNRDYTEIRLLLTYRHQASAPLLFLDELCVAVQGQILAREIR